MYLLKRFIRSNIKKRVKANGTITVMRRRSRDAKEKEGKRNDVG